MLRRLSIQNRSAGELRALAAERREVAAGKDTKVRSLLLNEARLLEFHADLRIWMQRGEPDQTAPELTARQHGGAEPPSLLSPDLVPLLSKLRSLGLPPADQYAILAAAAPPRQMARDETILQQGDLQPSLVFLCRGAARAYRTLEDGNQQNVGIFLPGDVLNPSSPVLGSARNSICALGPSILVEIPHRQLFALMDDRPAMMRALWLETALQSAIQREWIIWLGRRSAESRLAHFLCEVRHRLQLSDEDEGKSCPFPLTQRELADTIGLSPVHVNRVLQSLRRQRLVELDRSQLTMLNKEALYRLAEFDPEYLTVPRTFGARPA